MNSISAKNLKPLLTNGDEIAFLDVREHGQYGEGHPFFSVPFPYSRLEALASAVLPGLFAHLVLMDDGDGVAARAAHSFDTLGYQHVSILDGGARGWAAAGYTLFKGVNVPSKTYGELLEQVAETPRLTATELHQLMQRDPSVVVLDGRSPAEYENMSVPGALCCPNAELGYRLRLLAPDESTTIVVNCAGRTRSILGVEGLRILRIANPVHALENGTQGWRLAGFDLDHGVSAQRLPEPNTDQLATMAAQAEILIAQHRLALVPPALVLEWRGDARRTTYLFDVRTEAEFEVAHWPGARHAPGGQLVQATDQYVVVRNARIVLSDDIHLRAATTAIRLKEMGHDVYILDSDARTGNEKSIHEKAVLAAHESFADCCTRDATILDASTGMSFRKSHIDGARWVTRARLDRLDIDVGEPLLVTGQDPVLIEGVVVDLRSAGHTGVNSCVGTPQTWSAAGFELVASPGTPSDAECIDYLFFVHDRHEGNMDAARRYLQWETGLVDQLDAQERSVLNPGTH